MLQRACRPVGAWWQEARESAAGWRAPQCAPSALIGVIAPFVREVPRLASRVMEPRVPAPLPPSTFLVERYLPGLDLSGARDIVERLERAASAMTAEGAPVHHLGSILMPVDQAVLSLIQASDEGVVRRLNERAEAPADRIGAAISLPAGGTPIPIELGGTMS